MSCFALRQNTNASDIRVKGSEKIRAKTRGNH